jgi:hypothetical protein
MHGRPRGSDLTNLFQLYMVVQHHPTVAISCRGPCACASLRVYVQCVYVLCGSSFRSQHCKAAGHLDRIGGRVAIVEQGVDENRLDTHGDGVYADDPAEASSNVLRGGLNGTPKQRARRDVRYAFADSGQFVVTSHGTGLNDEQAIAKMCVVVE